MAITSLRPSSVAIAGRVGGAREQRQADLLGVPGPLVGRSSATRARRARHLKDACVMEWMAEQTTMALAARLQVISPDEIRDRQ
jgi:hypothetical protein